MRELAALLARVAELERRVSGTIRSGTVAEVDPARQRVRLDLGPGSAGGRFLSPWLPYSQAGGALKVHTPPTAGQQMTVLSPSGDMKQALAVPMTFSQANASPSGAGDQNVISFGDVTITLEGGALTITVGGVTAVISAGGLAITGGSVTHNGTVIDNTQTHSDVMPGVDNTGPPN